MGLLSGLMGNASQKNVDKVERDLEISWCRESK